MKNTHLYALWGVMFSLCAGLGFIPASSGFLAGGMTALSLLCFVPPALLLYQGGPDARALVRNLSAASLGLTLVLLVLNFLFALSSEAVGNVLHYALIIVSSPMVCSGYWVLSLFLWACLMVCSLNILKRK